MRNITMADSPIVGPQMDINGCGHVEVRVRGDGEVLWVNVNGICRLRICQMQEVQIIDERVHPSEGE